MNHDTLPNGTRAPHSSALRLAAIVVASMAGCGGRSAAGSVTGDEDGAADAADMGSTPDLDAGATIVVDCQVLTKRIEEPAGLISDGGMMERVARAYSRLRALAHAPTCDALVPGGTVSGSTSCDCDESGSLTLRGTDTRVDFDYDECCFGDCCINGRGALDTCGSGIACGAVTGTYACSGDSETGEKGFCVGSDGVVWVSVAVDGEEFAVSGSWTGGQFSVRDSRTVWDCMEDGGGAGCCVPQDGGGVLTWGGGTC